MLENEENKADTKKEELIVGDTNLEEGKVVLDEIPLIKEEVTLFDSIQASIIDQIVIGGASYILLIIFDFIMKLVNLRVVDKMGIYVIIYIIVNIIYSPIMEKTKMNNTVGRKVSNIKLIKK